MNNNGLKIHLGCGQRYLDGYVNIDYPPSEHTVMKVKADIYKDIRELAYPENSLEEVRSHHLLEHFSRQEALKLLLTWRRWLKPGGILHVETPDFGASADKFTLAGQKMRFELARHMFGSQEAKWAFHLDFWDKRKFKFVLGRLGFDKIKVRTYRNSLAQKYPNLPLANLFGDLLPNFVYHKRGGHKLPNIEIWARKSSKLINERQAVTEILKLSLVGAEGRELLDVWLKDIGF